MITGFLALLPLLNCYSVPNIPGSNSRRKTEEGHCTRRTELHSVIRLTEDNRTFDNSNQPAPLSHFNSSNNVGYQLVLTCTTNLEAMWTQQLYNMFHGHYEI
ncbi:uncharacterized protein [Dysidea avara]|uniref:uncharacterized protein isoform X1 n=1 Tax=Dysidea avara TaxID=196820 RepID=UPI00332746C0